MALRSLLPVFLAGVAAWGMSAVSAGAATYTTLYAMPGTGDGAGPQGGFVEAGSTLYGTTTYGGASGNGTIIKLDPATGTVTKLHDFAGGSDGFFPPANLLKLGGLLYGVTQYGGAQGLGTLFTYDPATRREAVVWSFGGPEGVVPTCTLIAVGGNLYGTTQYGGAHGDGTVFRLVPSTGTVSAVYSFSGGNDAANPIVGLALSGSSLYGTSPNGGANGAGVIFAVDPETGSESVVYNFGNGTDAAYPYAPLTAAKGVLYGTTTGGGTAGLGTVFSFNPASRVETILHGFSGATDGAGPVAGLSISNGVLYGATAYDGPSNGGTLFSLAVSDIGNLNDGRHSSRSEKYRLAVMRWRA